MTKGFVFNLAGSAFPPRLERANSLSVSDSFGFDLEGGLSSDFSTSFAGSATSASRGQGQVAVTATEKATPFANTVLPLQKQFQKVRALISERSHDAALTALNKLESMIHVPHFKPTFSKVFSTVQMKYFH